MAELGYFALQLGLFLSGYAMLVDLMGAWKNKAELIKSGRNATISCFACLTIAIIALLVSLVRSDFSIIYVAEHTSKALPLAYKLSALWAGAAGSLLLWLWLQVGFVAFVFRKSRTHQRAFSAGARSIANMVSVFFLLVLILDKNPFALSTAAPLDGAGLNPLLQHPAMVLHPPTLFIGYAAFAIPFAWVFARLKWDSTQGPAPFFKQAHNWILSAWLFLTVGIVLGAWWAYEELGWGGYWAWDPVENSSLMPWLTATALLHCSRTYRRNTSSANWLTILSLVTFSLCIFGTFLTRYGLVSSVHAFPEPGLGILFLVLLIHLWIIAAILLWRKHRREKIDTHAVVGTGQRFVILNNWLMVLLTFLIFVGTLFPFFSGLFTEQKISLKADYFTKITAPGGLVLLLLLGICPHLLRHGISKSWRIIGAMFAATIASVTWLLSHKIAPACFILCAFAALNLAADFLSRYTYNRTRKNTETKPRRNLRWYGARIVHVGVVLAFIGIAGSDGYGIEEHAALKPNDRISIAGFDITFDGLKADHGPNFTAVTADISVHKGQKMVTKLSPSQAYYTKSDKRTSEVDIRRTLAYDLYVALTEVDSSTELINLKILVKPLINWIWIGSIVMVLGVMLILASFYMRKITVTQDKGEGTQ
jgi:cytochrome c-type biogenesis protein CcmF